MRILSSLFQRYTQRLHTKPLSTKMLTSCFIFSTSDFICQRFVEKKSLTDYNHIRTARQTLVGTFHVAPTLHLWHSFVIPTVSTIIKSRFKAIAAAYALGEGVLSPYFLGTVLFLYGYLESFSMEAGRKNMQEKFLPTLIRSFQYWGVISLFTYSIVPIAFRPLFTNCWSMLWQVYMSHVGNMKSSIVIENVVEDDVPVTRPILKVM